MDIRCQYMNKKEYQFQISVDDYQYLAKTFLNEYSEFNEFINKNEENIFGTNKEFQLETEHFEKINNCFSNLFELIKLFCLISFLGGYNSPIQVLFTENGLFKSTLDLIR